jgi:phosphohistidine phosphatase SixA
MELLVTANRIVSPRPHAVKHVVLARHGESLWNEAKQKRGKMINNIRDAELSAEGIRDAEAIANWLATGVKPVSQHARFSEEVRVTLTGELKHSSEVLLLASNLRRAQMTAWIALQAYLRRNPKSRIYVLSALQEISSAIARDAVPLADEKTILQTSQGNYRIDPSRFDARNHKGNLNVMPAYFSDDQERFTHLCKWLSARSESFVAAFGHSSWIKSFFRSKLEESDHRNEIEQQLLRTKISPGAMIEFDLKVNPDGSCHIMAGSTAFVFGDFATKNN